MSIYFSRTSQREKDSADIARKVEDFLSAGGEIYHASQGQSAFNLKVRAIKNQNQELRLSWDDGSLSMRSRQQRFTDWRKNRSQASRVLSEKARQKRESLMPRVRELLALGKSRREIATIIDVTHGTINNWIKLDGGK